MPFLLVAIDQGSTLKTIGADITALHAGHGNNPIQDEIQEVMEAVI